MNLVCEQRVLVNSIEGEWLAPVVEHFSSKLQGQRRRSRFIAKSIDACSVVRITHEVPPIRITPHNGDTHMGKPMLL